MVNWKENGNPFLEFTEKITEEWIDKGFSKEQTKEWLNISLKAVDANYAWWFKNIKKKNSEWVLNCGDAVELREEYIKYLENKNGVSQSKEVGREKQALGKKSNWQENIYPFKKFTEELTQEWISCSFTKKETKEWLESGLKENDFDFAQWLRDIKKKEAEWFCDKGDEEELKKEYKVFLEEIANGHKISPKIIRKLKEFTPEVYQELGQKFFLSKWYDDLTPEKKILIDELIPNEELKERYKNYCLCKDCQQPNTGITWCQPCNSQKSVWDSSKWTSGNSKIDGFIQNHQLEADNQGDGLEWIPYEQFVSIEYLAKGGFGTVYKARWTKWNNLGDVIDYIMSSGGIVFLEKKKEFSTYDKTSGMSVGEAFEKVMDREKTFRNLTTVVLKSLHESQDISKDFLQEVTNYKLAWKSSKLSSRHVVQCYGISQDPVTKNYVMVMQYFLHRDLRHFLQIRYDERSKFNHGYNEFNFWHKLDQLLSLAKGLNEIHEKGLVHKDLHPGNILSGETSCFIADLGLCRLANEKKGENKIYGVLPYVAPEVLQGKGYTQAADIYSFGIITNEIFSCEFPHCGKLHDKDLAASICQGLRPHLTKLPSLLEELIKKCWDTDPLKRPTAGELEKTLENWLKEFNNKNPNSKFYQQYLEDAKEFNKATPYKFLSSEIHTISRKLDFPNLPQPRNFQGINKQFHNQISSKSLGSQIKVIETEINLLKEPLEGQLKDSVDKFIVLNKKLIKDENNEKIMDDVGKLYEELVKSGILEKDIEKIINYCERLVDLEQKVEREELQQSRIEVPLKN